MVGQVAAYDYQVAGLYVGGAQASPPGDEPYAGSVDEDPVRLALFHHLGVARHDGHSGLVGGASHRGGDPEEQVAGEAFLEDEAGREGQRAGAFHRKVVDGAADGHAAYVRAGELHRGDHVGVRGESEGGAGDLHLGGVLQGQQRGVGETFKEDLLHEFPAEPAAAAVAEDDLLKSGHLAPPGAAFLNASKIPMKFLAEGESLRPRL